MSIPQILFRFMKMLGENTILGSAILKGIGMGFLFLIGGALITGWTYYSAISNGGGRYLFTYGAIIGGIFMLVLGITNYLKASRYKG